MKHNGTTEQHLAELVERFIRDHGGNLRHDWSPAFREWIGLPAANDNELPERMAVASGDYWSDDDPPF